MTPSQTEAPPSVGISISESPDLRILGLSDGHLRDDLAAHRTDSPDRFR